MSAKTFFGVCVWIVLFFLMMQWTTARADCTVRQAVGLAVSDNPNHRAGKMPLFVARLSLSCFPHTATEVEHQSSLTSGFPFNNRDDEWGQNRIMFYLHNTFKAETW